MLKILLLLLMVTMPVLALPNEAALLKAAQARYQRHVKDYSSPGRFGMARCTLVRDGDRIWALTTCNSWMTGVTRGSEPKALWEHRGGKWEWLWDKQAILEPKDLVQADLSESLAKKLLNQSNSQPLRAGVLGCPRDPLLDSLRVQCLKRYPGTQGQVMAVAAMTPYRDTAFGITYGCAAADDESLYAVWEVKGGRWSWIFDFHFFNHWKQDYAAVHPLFAANHLSAGIGDALMKAIAERTP